MSTSLRILAFGVLVVVAAGVGWIAGDAVGPEPPSTTVVQHEHTESTP